jgi:hypothetical protein
LLQGILKRDQPHFGTISRDFHLPRSLMVMELFERSPVVLQAVIKGDATGIPEHHAQVLPPAQMHDVKGFERYKG